MFIFKHRLELHHFSASLSNLQVFLGAAALFLATSPLRNPSRRPDLPESENLRLFHVEHTICSYLNIGLNFTTSLQAYLIFKFFWGAAALFLATSLLRSPSRRPDLPEYESLRLFHVEHTICSYLSVSLKFPTSPQAFRNFKFKRGAKPAHIVSRFRPPKLSINHQSVCAFIFTVTSLSVPGTKHLIFKAPCCAKGIATTGITTLEVFFTSYSPT